MYKTILGATLSIMTFAISATAQNTFPSSGNVGIGTASPAYSLDVKGATSGAVRVYTTAGNLGTGWNNTADIYMGDTVSNSTYLELGRTAQTNGSTYIQSYASGVGVESLLLNMLGGYVGIGTTSPGARLEVNGGIKLTSGSNGTMTFADGTVQSTAWTGTICGGDFAESVDVIGERKHYEPGDVLVVDPTTPGSFLKSAKPYSTLVAGIYATKPGMVGHRFTDPKKLKNEIPMAMVGIVPTKVTAENGPIQAGDLLVTSSRLGYAMKGTDRERLTGAVVGKALGALKTGTGVIEVLVSLQ